MKVIATQYSPTILKVEESSSLEEIDKMLSDEAVLWVDVSGYEEREELDPLEISFNLNAMALDDCFNIRQRPKIEDYDDNLFLIARTVSEEEGKYAKVLQLGVFLGKNFVVTIHREPMLQLNEILEDVKGGKPQLAKGAPTVILYSILDTVIDSYEEIVGRLEERASEVGVEVLKNPPPENTLNRIYSNRRDMLLVRRFLRPQSDAVEQLMRGDYPLIDRRTKLFMRDVYDHSQRTLDRIDTLIDINAGNLDIYLSSVSNRMNEVMKLLTVLSTIGMPLTILVGWYGMNFQGMPEIYWTYGYATVILVAIAMTALTILVFRIRKWL